MAEQKKLYPQCGICDAYVCMSDIRTGQMREGEEPEYCPLKNKEEVIKRSLELYDEPENRRMAYVSAVQEFQNYEWLPERKLKTNITRIEEIMDFAKKMGYKKLGLAFCAGLKYEAKIAHQIFLAKGFDVVSVCCKSAATPKERIGLGEHQKIRGPGTVEIMCSPITQVLLLNDEKVDLAILMGLCVGHDTLFIKYLERPVTVLAVKDRVFGHCPIMALYLSQGPYYGRLLVEEPYESEVFPYKEHGRYDDMMEARKEG